MVATAARLVGGTKQAIAFAKHRHALWKVRCFRAAGHCAADVADAVRAPLAAEVRRLHPDGLAKEMSSCR